MPKDFILYALFGGHSYFTAKSQFIKKRPDLNGTFPIHKQYLTPLIVPSLWSSSSYIHQLAHILLLIFYFFHRFCLLIQNKLLILQP